MRKPWVAAALDVVLSLQIVAALTFSLAVLGAALGSAIEARFVSRRLP